MPTIHTWPRTRRALVYWLSCTLRSTRETHGESLEIKTNYLQRRTCRVEYSVKRTTRSQDTHCLAGPNEPNRGAGGGLGPTPRPAGGRARGRAHTTNHKRSHRDVGCKQ